MEWIFGGVLVPVIFGLWGIYRDRKKDSNETETRFSTIESRVAILETQQVQMQKELTEIQKLSEKIEKIQTDLVRVITLLEERTNKGKGE